MRSKLRASTARMPEQRRTLGGPVARGAGAVTLAGDDHRRSCPRPDSVGRAVERQEVAGGHMHGPAGVRPARAGCAPRGWCKAAHHGFPVAAAGGEDVEIARVLAALDQAGRGLALGPDRAGGRDVVGGDVVAEHQQRVGDELAGPAARDGMRERRAAQVVERGPRGTARPWRLERVPDRRRRSFGIGVGRSRLPQRLGMRCAISSPSARGRARNTWRPSAARPSGSRRNVALDASPARPKATTSGGEMRKAWSSMPVHAAGEVTVARQHGHRDDAALLDRLGHLRHQRAGVADAGGAAIADDVEAERVQVVDEAGALEIVRGRGRARRERGLDPGWRLEPQGRAPCARAGRRRSASSDRWCWCSS